MTDAEEIKDVKNLRITPDISSKLQNLVDDGFFRDKVDALRLGVSLALFHKLPIETVNFDSAGASGDYTAMKVDDTGLFRNTIAIMHSDYEGQEYRAMEKLIQIGVDFMYHDIMDENKVDIKKLMSSRDD